MSGQSNIQVISDVIYGLGDTFQSVLSDPGINFEREASFAVQVLEQNDYALGVAMKNRQSVINAVTNIAAIGISLNPAKKQAYLVPRDGRICLDISYMGLIDIALQSGSIRWAQAAIVHEADEFDLLGFDAPPIHKRKPFAKDRGDMVGVYVVVKTCDGDYLTHPMEMATVWSIRNRSTAWTKGALGKKGPWESDPIEMIKKTCVKQAYKYWPKSDRLDKAIDHLNSEGEGLPALPNVEAGDPELRDKWLAEIAKADTLETLEATWKVGVEEINAREDKPAYDAFKGAMMALHKKFSAPPPAAPDPEFVAALEGA